MPLCESETSGLDREDSWNSSFRRGGREERRAGTPAVPGMPARMRPAVSPAPRLANRAERPGVRAASAAALVAEPTNTIDVPLPSRCPEATPSRRVAPAGSICRSVPRRSGQKRQLTLHALQDAAASGARARFWVRSKRGSNSASPLLRGWPPAAETQAAGEAARGPGWGGVWNWD